MTEPRIPRAPILAVLGVGVVAIAVVLAGGWLQAEPTSSPGASPVALLPTASPNVAPTQAGRTASPGDAPSQSPTVAPARVAVVPVIDWRAGWAGTDPSEVAAVLAGTSERYDRLEVTAADRDAILALVADPNVPPGDPTVVVAPDAATLATDLAAHPRRLAFLRADEVMPAVRAIAWDDAELFGVERVPDLASWPLAIELPPGSAAPASPLAYDPATAWTLVAGGDVNLDGAVAFAVKNRGKGVDYPWDGGTARITSRWCCSRYGFEMANVERTGNRGAVRALLSGADLAIANFENPAPDDFTYHPAGFTFSADPALIEGVANAGIDWVSLANNHIRDEGSRGVLETLRNLDRWGIAHGGAGADLEAAREPSYLDAGGVRVAILAYDTIRPAYAATDDRPGSNQMTAARVREDVAAARAAGADLVIVFPHWGIEYTAPPSAKQRRLAHAAIDAGADLVLGNHTHWVGGIEVYEGRPIVYSMGDFVFNIDRSEKTQEGILIEATYAGERLVQLRVHPFFIVDRSQPNLLDPAGSGSAVMDQLFDASRGLLPW